MNTIKNNITPETIITSIVLQHPKVLLFLEHFDILLPLQQTKTVGQVCEDKNIRFGLFLYLLNLYIETEDATPNDLMIDDLPLIVKYLQNSHTYYLNDIYPSIQDSIQLLYKLNDTPEIKMVDNFFQNYFNEVKEHLIYENEIVFPYINSLIRCIQNKDKSECIQNTSYSVVEYKEHHDDIEEKLDDLVQLLIKYLPLKEDRQVRRKLFFKLTELNYDLKIHSLIEDLILIPLVEKMELEIRE